ncbi:MAG: discoidin domain-containing protein, partial [Patescibacteria group bacterium]
MVSVLREAGARSIGQNQGVSWGVHFQATSPTSSFFALFSGTYSSSSITIFVPFPGTLRFDTSTFMGDSKDVIFNKLDGKASASTSIRIYAVSNPSQFSIIRIASSGLILLDPESNLALGKTASQISTWPSPPAPASRAVDGNTDGDFWNGSVAHTNSQTQDWWEVDLGQTYFINTINVWNRTAYCPPN